MDTSDKISVLVVDDSALMRSLISKMIESDPQLRVMDKAMNGRFAFQRICIEEPDVIVLDIEMPEMNGLEFLDLRRKAGIQIPVIILSSVAQRGAAVTMQCLEKGAADFITKPSGSISMDIQSVSERLISLLIGFGGRYHTLRAAGKTKPIPKDLIKEFTGNLPASRPLAASKPAAAQAEKAEAAEKERPVLTSRQAFAPRPAPAFAQRSTTASAPKSEAKARRRVEPGKIELIAIGISTGGPNALRAVFPKLDPDVVKQPILVVQHMPPGFTEEFANSLNKICPLEVREARDGDLLKPGRVLIAPGDKHIVVEKRALATIARLSDEAPRNGHRPSADVLFESVCREYGNRALGIIMTGMGRDGAEELKNLYEAGSRTLGQDEASCIVYGMPRAAAELGAVDEQIPLDHMAETINRYAKEFG